MCVCIFKIDIHHYDNGIIYWVFISEDFYIEDTFKPFSPRRNVVYLQSEKKKGKKKGQ